MITQNIDKKNGVVNGQVAHVHNTHNTIDISYTLDSTSHPISGRKLKPARGRSTHAAAILVVPTSVIICIIEVHIL